MYWCIGIFATIFVVVGIILFRMRDTCDDNRFGGRGERSVFKLPPEKSDPNKRP